MRKKLTAVLLAATMLLTSGVTVFADRVDAVIDKPYLALGADLSPQEQMTVLSLLGLSDINVDDYDIISITNADEHEYLDKYLDASIIGTRALSSVLVVGKEAGNGIHVTTKNISYCTEGMYRNALLTAGIEDADITVAGPFSISGELFRPLSSVFLLWLKEARMIRNIRLSSFTVVGGFSCRVSRMTALPTFGRGIKQFGGTFATIYGSA